MDFIQLKPCKAKYIYLYLPHSLIHAKINKYGKTKIFYYQFVNYFINIYLIINNN